MSEVPEVTTVAITGSMGAGKSALGRLLSEKWPVISCDDINSRLLLPGQKGYQALVKSGLVSILPDGMIDKQKMAYSMFSNEENRKKIEGILHPLIFEEVEEWKKNQDSWLVFVEVPLLFEISAQDRFDKVWCVTCDEELALERLEKFRHITRKQAMSRLKAQFPPEVKAASSDYVIENNAGRKELLEAIEKGVELLKNAQNE